MDVVPSCGAAESLRGLKSTNPPRERSASRRPHRPLHSANGLARPRFSHMVLYLLLWIAVFNPQQTYAARRRGSVANLPLREFAKLRAIEFLIRGFRIAPPCLVASRVPSLRSSSWECLDFGRACRIWGLLFLVLVVRLSWCAATDLPHLGHRSPAGGSRWQKSVGISHGAFLPDPCAPGGAYSQVVGSDKSGPPTAKEAYALPYGSSSGA
jgi:hypothetical protein